jgi:uncharacterized Fe-S cluster-containing radical SAM superfamily protein
MDGTTDIKPLDPVKFRDPEVTADGSVRAVVALDSLATLWINTGTLCNLTCENCYIESSPLNDRLAYITAAEAAAYLDEIEALALGTAEIGFTGGEPFMNPHIIAMLDDVLSRGYRALVLTNAMRPMRRHEVALLDLRQRFGEALTIRVSVDHYAKELHEAERGADSWDKTIDGLVWLARNGFRIDVAGRTQWGESEGAMRDGFAALFAAHDIPVDVTDPARMVLFPEMDATKDVPEITEQCWSILGVAPTDIMCASSRMVVKRKGADKPAVVACTLLPYEAEFELGETLAEARDPVSLNHPHCAKFCVLGGGACSKG